MSIFDHTEEGSPQKYMEDLVRNLYKDADRKNIDFSSEKRPVTIYQDGEVRGIIIPTYTNLERTVQSLTNELDDWKKKYCSLSKERTILEQTLNAQRKLTEMYQEQVMRMLDRKMD